MDTTMSEVVQFIQENDVKFIRLAFCDIFGNQKNIAIMPTELERAFEQGIHFNAAALRGFLNVDIMGLPAPLKKAMDEQISKLNAGGAM